MATNQYQIYIENTFALAETLVIKSPESAEMMNMEILARYGPDSVMEDDPGSWKYYKNICGEYHFSDEMMYVTSLDTLETIEFTKESLSLHRATFKAYQYGSRYFKELVTRYPLKELLILGILYPADKDYALSAQAGSVLAYPKKLVEENEVSLISNIENWIKDYRARWYNVQFGMSDSLYASTHLGIMYLQLVPLILNLRLKACKTDEVHSFHIREYLGSHSFLDSYLDAMTRKQALWFYRNIAYIERNTGKQDTFHWLIEHVLTERGIPIVAYNMRHGLQHLDDPDYRPEIAFTKTALNQQSNTDTTKEYNIVELLDKEKPKTKGNPEYINENLQLIDKELQISLSDNLKTKVLESAVIDYTDATQLTLDDVLFNHWLWFTHKNFYSTYIRVKNPRNHEPILLHVKDAFIYYLYCWSRSMNITPITIPSFPALRVRRIPLPTADDLLSVAGAKDVTRQYVDELIARQPIVFPEPIVSTERFYNFCYELYEEANKQIRDVSNTEHYHKRGIMENVINRLYCDAVCALAPSDTLYTQWLNQNFLPYDDFTRTEFELLALDIYKEALGIGLETTISLSSLQRTMINLMEKLSSYSIQFISDINASSIRVLNWPAIRVGDFKSDGFSRREVNQINVRVLEQRTKSKMRKHIDVHEAVVMDYRIDTLVYNTEYEIKVKPKFSSELSFITQNRIMVGPMDMWVSSPDDDPDTVNKHGMVGSYIFDGLSDENKDKLRSVYRDCRANISMTALGLGSLFNTDTTNSFQHMGVYDNILSDPNQTTDTATDPTVLDNDLYQQNGLIDQG